MRAYSLSVIVLAVIALAACSSNQGRRAGGPPARDPGGISVDRLTKAYVRGVDLQGAGNCKAAIKTLYPVAMSGPGYEDAQRRLGECITREAGDDMTRYLEGLVWLRRSAEAGWPEAQGALAVEYADGPLPNLSEAAFWLALYDQNPRRRRPAFVAIPEPTIARLRTAIPQDIWADGAQRAESFQVSVWKPPRGLPQGQPDERVGSPLPERGKGKGGGRGRGRRGQSSYDSASAN